MPGMPGMPLIFGILLLMQSVGCADDPFDEFLKFVQSFLRWILDPLFDLEPQVTMNALQIIQYYGFSWENHTVTTADGFILQLYRIPRGRATPVDPARPPLLLVHGTKAEAIVWVLNPPNESMAFLAAEAGYDVWMANLRCSKASCRHKTLQRWSSQFWDWSWDEMAVYDLPVIIDHILNITGHRQLYYLGHSLGPLTAFVLLATFPEYNAKIRTIFGLASQGNFADANTVFRTGAQYEYFITIFTKYFEIYEFGLPSFLTPTFMAYLGKYFLLFEHQFLSVEASNPNINFTRLSTYLGQMQGSVSLQVLLNDAKTMQRGKILKRDFGMKKNLEKYGSPTPPENDFKQVKVPTYLYYGKNDSIVGARKNAEYLKDCLGNVIAVKEVGSDWGHQEMTLAMNAANVLYNEIILIMNSDFAKLT